jgi:hypothetical protein
LGGSARRGALIAGQAETFPRIYLTYLMRRLTANYIQNLILYQPGRGG